MKFDVNLTITHPELEEPIKHNDQVEVISANQLYYRLKLSNKQICDLRNYGKTSWEDNHGAFHVLEVVVEA